MNNTEKSFEPRDITDITDDHVIVSVYDGRAPVTTSAVRVVVEAGSLHLDAAGARKLAQALLDAADALPLRDGWYAYTYGLNHERYSVRFYRGEQVDDAGNKALGRPRTPLTYIGPLADEDIAQIESLP